MSQSDVRKGENESFFREVNERLEDRAAVRSTGRMFTAVCECAREECAERIEISFEEYERVRSAPKAFVIVPGHSDPSCERVVSWRAGYEIVEKVGDAGAVAEREDPR
ncbi:MAG TPA: hypothetical protein VH063_16645 [Gaiellaceae bacterium]|jgi:hypothetical protein|nr:hypothetical protein [Gaiellaceae bacterium]